MNSLNLYILNQAKAIKETLRCTSLTEAVVFVCPNPKCGREIEEPIMLTILSVTPPQTYEACPYCFSKLEPELPAEQKTAPEPDLAENEEVMEEETTPSLYGNSVLEKVKVSAPQLLRKVKALIPNSNGSQNEKIEKTEAPRIQPSDEEENLKKEEPKTETVVVYEASKETPKIEQSAEKESGSSGCPQTFGYLATRPSDAPIPSECLLCPRIVDCMLKTEE